MSKLAVQSFGCFIIGPSSFFRSEEIPDMFVPSANLDLRFPSLIPFKERHTLEPARVGAALLGVAFVLAACALAKVRLAIVETIPVAMIYLGAVWDYHLMQVDRFLAFIFTLSVKTFGCWIPIGAPIPLRQPFKVFRIHDGILSLREGNQPVGSIRWLSNGMPFKAVFRHESSAKGFMYSAILHDNQGTT